VAAPVGCQTMLRLVEFTRWLHRGRSRPSPVYLVLMMHINKFGALNALSLFGIWPIENLLQLLQRFFFKGPI